MAKSIPRGNRALFHHRDSTGRHDQTPGKYVEWAQAESQRLGLRFDGTPAVINSMIRNGKSVVGDIYLDYNVQGNLLDRPALSSLLKRIADDREVSHVFIPLRERLARPDDPEDGVKLEKTFSRAGVTIHFQDCVVQPLAIGERAEIGQSVTALVAYDQAGIFRRELARKMIEAQRSLGEQGFSTGGRPPFFLRRWLIDPHDNPIRELADGEIVRRPGHHVAWLPTSEDALELALRIVGMLEKMPASSVARTLTREGIPSPDAERFRKDWGIEHKVSGVWHSNTVVNVVRSLYLVGQSVYGRRSMGDQKRFSITGPRDLTEDDRREDGKPKVIQNPESEWITAPAKFAPLVEPERMQKLLADLDQRGASQRGKPRSPDAENNPLGCRVFDMNCGWLMYHEPYKKKNEETFRYKCGAYTQSHRAVCTHNWVDGPTAARFTLGAIRQRLFSPRLRNLIEDNLTRIAKMGDENHSAQTRIAATANELSKLNRELETVQRNLARAQSDTHYAAIAAEFDTLKDRERQLNCELQKLSAEIPKPTDPEKEIAAALELHGRLRDLASRGEDFIVAKKLFDLVNAKLFLKFRQEKWGKRVVNKTSSGVMTFGDSPPPIKIYEGRTGRVAVLHALEKTETAVPRLNEGGEIDADGRGDSLGNVSRGDRI